MLEGGQSRGASGWVLPALVVAGITILSGLIAGSSLAGHGYINGRHLSDADRPKAWVTFVDHTGSQWPVLAAAVEWDFAGRLDVQYRGDECNGAGHCVPVAAQTEDWFRDLFGGNLDDCNENPGFSNVPGDSSGHIATEDAYIKLNQGCNALGDRVQRVFTCHEEGHLLGLRHVEQSLRQETCMAASDPPPHPPFTSWEETPRPHDFGELDEHIYDHNDGS